MTVIEKPRAALQAGITCDACRAPIPPSTLHRVTCPTCRQTYATSSQ